MVTFRQSQNYVHNSLLDKDGIYRPKPLLIVGSSGSGKSVLVEKMVSENEENIPNSASLFMVDQTDTIEAGFAMFPADDPSHLKRLSEQLEDPQPAKNVKLWCVLGSGFKDWQKKSKKLPEMEVFTLSARSILRREELMYLLETPRETKALRLMLACGEMLKNDESLDFLKSYGKGLISKKRFGYLGKDVETGDSAIGDSSDLRDGIGSLAILEREGIVMPHNFKHNLNMKKILNQPGRHIFIYKALMQDPKLRDFVFFHLVNEFTRCIGEAKHPVNLVIEEIQSKAPYKAQGYSSVLAARLGDIAGTVRKTGRGVSFFMVGRAWSEISEEVRAECKKQILFHIDADDMLKFVKVGKIGVEEKVTIEHLEAGEYVVKGFEKKAILAKVPKHGHKHPDQDFLIQYRKYFPDKLRNYSEIIKDAEEESKRQSIKYQELLKAEIERRKSQIRREVKQKTSVEKTREEIALLRDEDAQRKKEEKVKRDQEIVKVFQELKAKGEKASTRQVAEETTRRGYKVSHVTVKGVLQDFLSLESRPEEKAVNP